MSWPIRNGFFNQPSPIDFPATSAGRVELIKKFADKWAEPFRPLAHSIQPSTTEVKCLELYDWPPPKGLRTNGRVALVGDALHPMAMCKFPMLCYSIVNPGLLQHANTTRVRTETDRGEGSNHALIDVQDLVELVLPPLLCSETSSTPGDTVRAALDRYEDRVVSRTRPAVLASRQACLDAHRWSRINETSPLLSRRVMNLVFDEGDMDVGC